MISIAWHKSIFYFVLPLFLFAGLQNNTSASVSVSPNAEITLLTASPGDELYSVFGHSAVRVYDPDNNLDLVFNYGTFDFDTPNFYLQFTRGKLLYKLSVVPMSHFMIEYSIEGRAVFEQVLNLNSMQKQKVFAFLMNNSLPENAYYHYDFFYDNCATRIRDLVDDLLDPVWPSVADIHTESLGLIRSALHYEFDYAPEFTPNRTFRDLLQPFLTSMPWSAFGIDLALGLPADQIAEAWDFMYLPDEMLIAFALAYLPDGKPLVSEHRVILPKTVELSPAAPITPIMVSVSVFILAVFSLIHKKVSRIFDKAFFSVLGLVGIVVIFLWFFTDHITTKSNLNILWAIPTHLYFIWVAGYKPNRPIVKWYFNMVLWLSLSLLVLWPFIPQGFHPAFFWFTATSLVKSLMYVFKIPLVGKRLYDT